MRIRSLAPSALVLFVLATSCRPSDEACDPPPETSYTCSPAANAHGCGPYALSGSDAGVSETYPVGCTVVLPECAPMYEDSVASCTCRQTDVDDSGTAPAWACPM